MTPSIASATKRFGARIHLLLRRDCNMTSVSGGRTQALRNDTASIEILINRQNKIRFHNYSFRDSD
jgi:hypothetical protein